MLASNAAAQPVATASSPRYLHVAPAESLAVFGATTRWTVASPSAAGVVLLPGTLGSAFALRHVTRSLEAAGVRVVVLDPLGMGASGRPRDADYSLEAQARRVVQVLDSLGWRRALVAGQGTSATIALRVAARAPERVLGVVSIAGGPVATQGTDGVRTALRRIRAPVHVFVGREPRPGAPSTEQLALLVRLVPNARVDSVAGTGVLLHEETPEVIARGILALLARTVTVSAR